VNYWEPLAKICGVGRKRVKVEKDNAETQSTLRVAEKAGAHPLQDRKRVGSFI